MLPFSPRLFLVNLLLWLQLPFLLVIHKSISLAENHSSEFQAYIYNCLWTSSTWHISSTSKSTCVKSAFILFYPSTVFHNLSEWHHYPSSWPSQKSKFYPRLTLPLWYQSGDKWSVLGLQHWWKWWINNLKAVGEPGIVIGNLRNTLLLPLQWQVERTCRQVEDYIKYIRKAYKNGWSGG